MDFKINYALSYYNLYPNNNLGHFTWFFWDSDLMDKVGKNLQWR